MRHWLSMLWLVPAIVAGCAEIGELTTSRSVGRPLIPLNDAVLLATLEADGRRGTYRLTNRRDGFETWSAPDGSAFVFDDGILVASFGLGHDLYSADVSEVSRALAEQRSGSVTRVHNYLDGENDLVTRAFRCTVTFEPVPEDRGDGATRQATEACRGSRSSFRNTYLLSVSGGVVASSQWVGEVLGSVRFGSGRAPAAGAPLLVVPPTLIGAAR